MATAYPQKGQTHPKTLQLPKPLPIKTHRVPMHNGSQWEIPPLHCCITAWSLQGSQKGETPNETACSPAKHWRRPPGSREHCGDWAIKVLHPTSWQGDHKCRDGGNPPMTPLKSHTPQKVSPQVHVNDVGSEKCPPTPPRASLQAVRIFSRLGISLQNDMVCLQ